MAPFLHAVVRPASGSDHEAHTSMTTPLERWFLARFGVPAPGRTLHHAALAASHEGERAIAAVLFERAVRAYRRDLDVHGLARLRIHETLVRLRTAPEAHAGALAADAERALARLDAIESLEPPFAPVPAEAVLSSLRRDHPQPAARAA